MSVTRIVSECEFVPEARGFPKHDDQCTGSHNPIGNMLKTMTVNLECLSQIRPRHSEVIYNIICTLVLYVINIF